MGFKRIGLMVDCSRNAVMRPEFTKGFIDTIAAAGYNALMLYTEDTYEIEGEPFFGHLRGRYSKTELKELDAYANEKGVELIPCIQTLAHLNALMHWNCYTDIRDCNDILLVGDERTYALIEKMFATTAECFASRTINIGMDEAWLLGRGSYYDKHGPRDRFDILLEHLERVSEIAEKYDYKLQMWGDMFFHLARADYYDTSKPVDDATAKRIAEKIPHNVTLIYWDYYSTNKARYDSMLRDFKKLDENTVFAGGFWTWAGFTPKNSFSIAASRAALESCAEYGVDEVYFTMWGDSGGECSRLAVLPSIFYTAGMINGKTDEEIKADFENCLGIAFDDFMLLDLPYSPCGVKNFNNPEKYLLYNDVFLGRFDGVIRGGENELYKNMAEKLRPFEENERFGYLFTTQRALCEVLSIKAELGIRTKEAYKKKDMEAIKALIGDYSTLSEKLEEFYEALEYQWMVENKPHGFDMQDIRLGGLKQRIAHCTERLEDFVSGTVDRIEELEGATLHPFGINGDLRANHRLFTSWADTVTPNNIW